MAGTSTIVKATPRSVSSARGIVVVNDLRVDKRVMTVSAPVAVSTAPAVVVPPKSQGMIIG